MSGELGDKSARVTGTLEQIKAKKTLDFLRGRMFQVHGHALDHLKDVPGFKALLKAVLKSQIQLLVEQLAAHTDEESIVLSASVSDGGLSYLGSEQAREFLEHQEEIKSQFLRFCLEKHHHKLRQAKDLAHQKLMSAVNHNNQLGNHPYMPADFRSNHRKAVHPVPQRSQRKPHPLKQAIGSKDMNLTNIESQTVLDEHKPNSYPTSQFTDVTPREPAHAPHIGKSDGLIDASDVMSLNDSPKVIENGEKKQLRRESSERVRHEDDRSSVEPEMMIVKSEPVTDFPENNGPLVSSGSSDSIQQAAFTGNSVVFPPRPGFDMMDWTIGQNNNQSEDGNSQSHQQFDTQPFSEMDPAHLTSLMYDTKPLNMSLSSHQKHAKKRVYKKVECEFCHKMVYVTNIKVHRFRHMQNQHYPLSSTSPEDLSQSQSLS